MKLVGARNSLLCASASALAACGGGGGGAFVQSTPPPAMTPTPTPTPTPALGMMAGDYIVARSAANQAFESYGSDVSVEGQTGAAKVMSTINTDQPQIRYNSASSHYEIALPEGGGWQPMGLDSSEVPNTRDLVTGGADRVFFQLHEYAGTGYLYSALAWWSKWTGAYSYEAGGLAFGIPTPAGGVPLTGSATYNGSISGLTTETSFDNLGGQYYSAILEGGISLSFDFGAGKLSGNISPTVYNLERKSLAPMSFTDTVYSSGNTRFSGKFDTSLPGANSFSGEFTGPNAQELIGGLTFPYKSPDDGKVYQAAGGFLAKQ